MLSAILKWTKKNKSWLFALCVIVVFCTTYVLILPAITLEQDEAAKQGGIDVPTEEVIDAPAAEMEADAEQAAEDGLSFEGDGYQVSVAADAKAGLPSDTQVVSQEITSEDADYEAWRDEALKAIQDQEGADRIGGLKFAKFYDITLASDGTEIEPSAPVDVTIAYDKALKVNDADHIRIVHFTVDKKGSLTPQVLDPSDVQLEMKEGRMTAAAFPADSFSVYAVVYTVDFHYEVNGETFEYSMEGDGSILLSQLLEALTIDISIGDIADVTFSDQTLLEVTKDGDDWTLQSLQAFDTEETLTITLTNGDRFTVRVTDAQEIPDAEKATIDPSKSYLICYEVNGVYYLLKTDGTVDSTHHPDFEGDPDASHDFEHLNSSYAWSFNHIFKEQDVEHHLDKNYYLIRPIDKKSRTLTLNNTGEALVQQGNNNVAVIQSGNGFILEGYHNVGTEDAHRYIHLGFDGSKFVGVDGEGVTIHIYEMDSLPTYDYTIRSADGNRGKVVVDEGSPQTEIQETSNHDKKNAGAITATPVDHKNTTLNQGETGYGENKWQFDHWELDGLPLDRNQYPATITAGSLSIPHNGSNLVAYFRQNPNYVVPDSEKEPTTVEDMSNWLNELQNKDIPLDITATQKTAEVYDYTNRIYRVDFNTRANFQTFGGSLDLAFCMDVSNSMKFPSKLVRATTNYNDNTNPIPIYQINRSGWGWDNRTWLDTNRTYNNPYYLIADEAGTATVFRIYYQDGNWKAQDASRTGETNQSFIIGNDFRTAWTKTTYDDGTNRNHPFNAGDSDSSTYVIYNDGDPGNDRFHYLQESFKGGTSELNVITELLQVAGDASPDVRIAYNTFSGSLGSYWQDFASAAELDVKFRDNADGGTRPDYAFGDLEDTEQYHWNADKDNRYVVLITDGAPQSGGLPKIAEAIEAANHLKQELGVKIITVGLSMQDVEIGKRFLYDIADTDKSGNKMFYLAESGDDLHGIIRKITKAIMEDVVVIGDITDTVSEAFYLVDKDTGMPLVPGNMIDIEGNRVTDESQAAGVVQEDGRTVKWINQSIDHTNGWHGVVYVKAKEQLLGGNAVNTNAGNATVVASKYRAGGTDVYFDTTSVKEHLKLSKSLPSPKVNVNELTFFNNETEWTVYLGEEVDPKQQLKALYDSLVVEEVVNKDGSLHYTLGRNTIEERWDKETGSAATFSLPGLIETLIRKDLTLEAKYFSGSELNWDNFLTDMMSSTGITLPYHEFGLTDNGNIKITLEKTIASGEESDLINESPHETSVTGNQAEKYVLRIAYEPDYSVTPVGQGGQSTEDFHTGTFGTMYQGHAAGRETSTNTHLINVYNVPLDVYKTDNNNDPLAGATFKLYKEVEENGAAVAGLDSTKQYIEVASATSGNDGIARLQYDGKDFGLVLGEKYYLIESSAPANYTKVNTVWEVEVQTEIGKFTDLNGKKIYSEINPNPDAEPPVTAGTGVTNDMYPFNWDQGARIMLDGKQPLTVIAKGEGEDSTTTITDGSFVSHKKAVSFRHTVLNIGGNIDINVNKTWKDENDPPESITVKLYRVSEKGHQWGNGKVVPCTCTKEGVEEYTCSECGAKDTHVISTAGHTPGEAHRENEVEATCTTVGGYDTVVRCTVCNAVISTEHTDLPMVPHTWVNQETTSTDSQYCYDTVDICSVCNAANEETRIHHEHDWGEWAVTTPAQPGVAGVETRVCNHNTAHTETRAIDSLPNTTAITYRAYRDWYQNGRVESDVTTAAIYPIGSTVTLTWTSQYDYNTTAYINSTRQDATREGYWPGHDFTFTGGATIQATRTGSSPYYYSVTVQVTENMTIDLKSDRWDYYPQNISISQPEGNTLSASSGLRTFFSIQSPASARDLNGDSAQILNDDSAQAVSDELQGNAKSTPTRDGSDDTSGDSNTKGDDDAGESASTASSISADELQAYLNGLKTEDQVTCAANAETHTYKEEVGEYTITAANNWTLPINDLPKYNEYGKEYSYYVVETSSTYGYDVTYTGQDAGLHNEESTTINNKKLFGSLKITKTIQVAGGPAEQQQFPAGTYSYPVLISTVIGQTTYYVQDVNGTLATTPPETPLTVTAGEPGSAGPKLTIDHLPYGTYHVSEIQPDSVEVPGYSFVVQETGPQGEIHFQSVTFGEGTVEETTPQVDLVNYYKKGASWTPEVDKQLNGLPHSEGATGYSGYTFVLTEPAGQDTIRPRPGQPHDHTMTAVTDENGQAVFGKIDYHLGGNEQSRQYTYTITETRPAAAQDDPYIADDILYDSSTIYVVVTVTKTGNGHNMVTEAHANYYSDEQHTQPLTAVVFNNKELASLSVTKTVTGDYTPTSSDTFPITIKKGNLFLNSDGELVEEDPQLTIKSGQTLQFENIPVGTYVVTEGDAEREGYSLEVTYTSQVGDQASETQTIELNKGDEGSVGIENAYYQTDITIIKIDETTRGTQTQTTLSNATFRLCKYTIPEGSTEGAYTVYPNETDCDQTTDSDGSLQFTGLNNGKYCITEIAEPDGYVSIETLEIYFKVENGVITWTNAEGAAITSQNLVSYAPDDKTFTVGNTPGAALPHTGGPGTTWIYLLGSLLLIGCGTLLIARRRIQIKD